MYQSIYYDRSTYTFNLRDDKTGWSEFKYHRPRFKIDPNGQYPTLDGKRANAVTKYDWKDNSLYESDLDAYTSVLIDKYKDSDDAAEWQNIVYFDIECEIAGALTPELIKNAPTKITSIAVYDNTTQKYYCLILDEKQQLQTVNEENRAIIPFSHEHDLLHAFLNLWEQLDPTIITGWNTEYFDVPFLYYRIENQLGTIEAARMSPLRKIKFGTYSHDAPVELAGLNHLDYMLLFKKYNAKQEPSYKLGDIGEKYVGLTKIEYEGNLDRLFQEDINKFIEYNIRDVEILIELEKKFKFIELTIAICHLCHVPYEQIYLSTALNDGAILTYLKRQGIVSPNKPTTIRPALYDIKEEYAGGYLKDPVPGLYEWVIDLDFTSLYPSIIRSLNIGIETYIGRIVNRDKYDNNWTLDDLKGMDHEQLITIERLKDDKTTTQSEIKVGQIIDYIEQGGMMIAASGAIFRTDKPSVVCEVLTDWFNKRVEYKNLMKKAYKAGDAVKGEFYNRRQHAYKIKLNDVYGCYAINGWRYTDGHKIISKAITLTGQRLLQESIKNMNVHLNNYLGVTDKDHIVTSDTDSLFIQVRDVLISKGVDLTNKAACIKATLEIAAELQIEANKFISKFAKEAFNIKADRQHYFDLKQEVVIERGYFAGKRRYAMYIVNKEGVTVDEMVMMGLDLMKSNMTPMYRKFGEELLQQIMFGAPKSDIDKRILDFKKYVKDLPLGDIAKPTGVKQVASYIDRKPGIGEIFSTLKLKCPINTKAAVWYNDLLRFKKLDKKYPCFREGDKMRYIQLKDNPYRIDVIGFTGNDPEFINDFMDKYADREQGFESSLMNKLVGIYDDLGWVMPSTHEKAGKFFKFD
jgi:DNA polymerase elongation subunit (family B)